MLGFGLVSARAGATLLSAPMVFTALGLLVGPAVFGWVELGVSGEAVRAIAEITLVLTLFSDASRIDLTRLRRGYGLPLRLLAVGLPLTVMAGALAGWLLFPALGLPALLLIAVILAPTDAALGQAVVSDASVPARIRQALNVESGLNDGLSFPALLVIASIAGTALGDGPRHSAAGWAAYVAGQVTLGPLVGILIGWAGARAVNAAVAAHWMSRVFLRLSTVALALAAYAGAELAGGNGFIAAFAAGSVAGSVSAPLARGNGDFGETEGQLLGLLVFALLGAVILPDVLEHLDWRHFAYAALSLTLVRMVPVAMCLAGTGLRAPTVAFIGWFGPRGLASVIYLQLVMDGYRIDGVNAIAATVAATVCLSIVLHGATATPFARLYGRWVQRRGTAAEHKPVPEFDTRPPLSAIAGARTPDTRTATPPNPLQETST